MPELLDLENSFEELKSLPTAKYLVLPINADVSRFEDKILKQKFPCWIKLNSSEHKLKLQAVKKVLNPEELKAEYKKLQKQFPGKKFIIQENIEGTEIIAGIKQDKTFGKVLLLGTGGSLAEIIKDVQFRILPLEKSEIEQALKELKIYRILQEKNANINSLVKLIEDFSKLALKKEIEEADLNPIIVNEKQALIVDARISI